MTREGIPLRDQIAQAIESGSEWEWGRLPDSEGQRRIADWLTDQFEPRPLLKGLERQFAVSLLDPPYGSQFTMGPEDVVPWRPLHQTHIALRLFTYQDQEGEGALNHVRQISVWPADPDGNFPATMIQFGYLVVEPKVPVEIHTEFREPETEKVTGVTIHEPSARITSDQRMHVRLVIGEGGKGGKNTVFREEQRPFTNLWQPSTPTLCRQLGLERAGRGSLRVFATSHFPEAGRFSLVIPYANLPRRNP